MVESLVIKYGKVMDQERGIVCIPPNKNTQEIQITLKIVRHYNINEENTMYHNLPRG